MVLDVIVVIVVLFQLYTTSRRPGIGETGAG